VQKNPKPKIETKNRSEKPVNRDENNNFFGSINQTEKNFCSRFGFGSAGPENAVNRG